jgi:isopenicillin N synthase-like dioxygenase
MIPVLDFTRFTEGTDREGFVADLGAAARGPGFFLLKGHGIAPELQAEVFAQADAFFALPVAEKEAVSILKTPHYRGWAHDGLESLDETSGLKDRKESFNIGFDLPEDDPRVIAGEPFRGVNQWPDLPGFRETMLAYYDAALDLGIRLARAIALDLGLAEDHFDCALSGTAGCAARAALSARDRSRRGDRRGRAFRLRGRDAPDDGRGAGASGETARRRLDGRAACAGRLRGQYRRLPDALDERHLRLHAAPGAAAEAIRRSVAMFVEAHPDTMVEALPGTGAPKYAPIRAADYLQSRLDATYNETVGKA